MQNPVDNYDLMRKSNQRNRWKIQLLSNKSYPQGYVSKIVYDFRVICG